MAIINSTGWLEDPWLTTAWLLQNTQDATGAQAELKINTDSVLGAQVELKIETEEAENSQAELQILDALHQVNAQGESQIKASPDRRVQVELKINTDDSEGAQAELQIDTVNQNNSQAELAIETFNQIKAETELYITDVLGESNAQVELQVLDASDANNVQVYSSNLYWYQCGNWLEQPWLTTTWLAKGICAGARTQTELRINTDKTVGGQVELRIDKENDYNSQVELQIEKQDPVGAQVDLEFAVPVNSQVTILLYNTTRPRILCEFPSRGTTGLNWVASTTEPGDYSILNINNDISEYYWRSETGATTAILDCDTEIPQGIFMDTFYAEGHNFTSSAIVTLEASNDPAYATIGKTINLIISDEKIFHVEPVLPLQSYRYWRLRISDPTNPDGYLKMGLVVFGAAEILNSECTTQDIILSPKEFKNAVRTEGFTSIGNSRSLKRAIRFTFRNISYDSGDYDTLNDVINFSRTTLKCLWIPDPRTTSLMERFAVFGKLKKIPTQNHNVKGIQENLDFVNFAIDIDEAE